LEEFGRGGIDILLGTQMVAKGHDFPGVTLVGVVQADAGLSLPDFRAAERTFQLLAQVAGRAGRGEQPGDVYVQTLCPEHDAIRFAAAQDYRAFFERESSLRRDLRYPPFARLLGITGLGPDRGLLHESMGRVEAFLRGLSAGRSPGRLPPATGTKAAVLVPRMSPGPAISGGSLQVLGPAPSPIPRLRGRYREQILVKGTLEPAEKLALQRRLAEFSRTVAGVEFQVDVDPAHML
jgi:primosomal protein N' (replication factor Y)